ncbi:MAG: serine hydrolase domain-containing protein [Nitrospinales bacterium]
MHLLRKELVQALSSSVLIFFLIITGCKNQAVDSDEVPIEGAVYSVHRADGSQKTYMDVVIGRQFSGRLPDDIDSIIVSGPHGDLSIDKDDFNYNHQWRAFWIVRPDIPEIGTYTFKVTSGNRSGRATDIQSNVSRIPLPDTNKFFPSRGEAVTCTPPIFSWKKLNNDGPLFYQVEIRDTNRKHVYRTHYVRDMESVRLPPGILSSSNTYQWRIRVADGADWISLNNRSQSSWVAFTTNKNLDTCKYSYHSPINIDGSWEVSSLEEQEVDPQKIRDLMHQILNDNLKNIHSILLIKNGKLILEEYFCGYHRDLKHPVASVTKSVTSILFGIARDLGYKIVLNKKLITYLPEYKDLLSRSGKSKISLEHLLTMRAGLEWNEFSHSNFQGMYESNDPIKFILEKEMVDAPGQRFFYSTGLSTVLGRILENTTGYNAEQFAGEYLFTPLEIKDYYWGKLSDGSVLTGSSLSLRPRDMAKLGYLLLKEGFWWDKQIVSKEWVRESIFPHVKYPHDKGDLISGTGYGYQWWRGTSRISNRDIDAFYAAGHGGQFICVIPSLDLITVITSQVDDNDTGDFRAYSVIDNYVIPAVLQTDPVRKIPPFDVENYRHVTGKYSWPKAELPLKIHIDNGKIYGNTILFDGKFELLPVEKSRFMCISEDVGNFWLDIMEDSKGNIEGVRLNIGFSYLPFKRTRGLFLGY